MIRLGKFDKDGYKQNFSKGELARELVCMNKDYEDLEKENKKYKEVIDKANKWVRDYMDEWNMNDEVWQDLNDLLILLEEVEHEKSNN